MNIYSHIRHMGFFIPILAAIFLQSCAPISIQHPHPPYNDREISDILETLKIQEDAVYNFFSLGRIMIQGRSPDFEANALIIGTRDPFKIKLEITHFWGRPIFHILITEKRLHIISFPEKRYYLADMRKPLPSELLALRLDTDQLWAIGRGFPILCKHNRAESNKAYRISLLNTAHEIVQVIDFHKNNIHPAQVFFPSKGLRMSFSDLTTDNGIEYAQKTQLHDQAHETTLSLNFKQIAFNKVIQSSIFEMPVPPDFECIRDKHLLDTQ